MIQSNVMQRKQKRKPLIIGVKKKKKTDKKTLINKSVNTELQLIFKPKNIKPLSKINNNENLIVNKLSYVND